MVFSPVKAVNASRFRQKIGTGEPAQDMVLLGALYKASSLAASEQNGITVAGRMIGCHKTISHHKLYADS